MSRPRLVATSDDEGDIAIPDADANAIFQSNRAFLDLGRAATAFLEPPSPMATLAELTGGIPEGDIWYAGGFSGDGKTAFFTSLTLALVEAGKRVYYVPTETPARVLRNHFAAKTLGYDVADMLSGAWLQWPNYTEIKAAIRAELKRQVTPGADGKQTLWVANEGLITTDRLEAEAAHAKELKADVFIVDHIDHVEGNGKSLYDASVDANKTLLHIAQTYGLRVLAATQFNLDAVRGDRVMRHMAPRENYVYMGNYKRQIASGMLGLYRPLRLVGLDEGKVKSFNKGAADVTREEILEPNTMAVSLMKHRLYGGREGRRIFLRVCRGRVTDLNATEREAMEHEIPT